MSTGAECNFWEEEPGRWKYRLQHYPYGETDDFDTFGPFAGFRAAYKHLHDNHANPGGFSTRIHETGHVHEWEHQEFGARVPYGVEVRIKVESLGADPTRSELMKLIRSLPDDHPAITTTPLEKWGPQTACASCYQPKENTNAR